MLPKVPAPVKLQAQQLNDQVKLPIKCCKAKWNCRFFLYLQLGRGVTNTHSQKVSMRDKNTQSHIQIKF